MVKARVLLFPFVDTKNHFHIDHVFPRSLFTPAKLKKAKVPDDDIEICHGVDYSSPLRAGPPMRDHIRNHRDSVASLSRLSSHLRGTTERRPLLTLNRNFVRDRKRRPRG